MAQELTLPVPGERNPVLIGTCFGLFAAMSYTGSNMALRELSVPGDLPWAMWANTCKDFCPMLVAWSLIFWNLSKGMPAFPPAWLFPRLLGAALLNQFGGNLMFQWSLGLGGLALAVPLTFAAIITTGAVLGRVLLAEPVTTRSASAMGVLMMAIVLLGIGAQGATLSVFASATPGQIAGAIVTGCLSGIAFGISGVTIRYSVSRNVPVSATLVTFSTTGCLSMGTLATLSIGPAELLARCSGHYPVMFAAGAFNALGFFAIAQAFKRLSVVQTNLLNATQIVLCSLAGVLFFREQFSIWLMFGTTFTVLGLLLMDNRRKPSR